MEYKSLMTCTGIPILYKNTGKLQKEDILDTLSLKYKS